MLPGLRTTDDRNKLILAWRREGFSLRRIAAVLGISRQRVQQIVDRANNRDAHLAREREKNRRRYWRNIEKERERSRRSHGI
jgi:DNA-directed RNA polymerase specialized sigma subunit